MSPEAHWGRPGRFITFYSYKGGTGRSMALANAAWILASNGRKVLAVDWDLEAPGLHRYFHPFLLDPGLTETSGIIDLFTEYSRAYLRRQSRQIDDPQQPSAEQSGTDQWFAEYADLRSYAQSVDWDVGRGSIDVVGAGQQGDGYAERVNLFDWDNLIRTSTVGTSSRN